MTDLRQGVTPIQHEVFDEIDRAMAKFPTWPTDPLHALAVLGEEFGELTKAVLQSVYEPHKSTPTDVREEAVQTAAMALRFLASLDHYFYLPGIQHHQLSGGRAGAADGSGPAEARGDARQEHSEVLRAAGIPDDCGGGSEHSAIMREIMGH